MGPFQLVVIPERDQLLDPSCGFLLKLGSAIHRGDIEQEISWVEIIRHDVSLKSEGWPDGIAGTGVRHAPAFNENNEVIE